MSQDQIDFTNKNANETKEEMTMVDQIGESSKAVGAAKTSPKTVNVNDDEHPLSLSAEERELHSTSKEQDTTSPPPIHVTSGENGHNTTQPQTASNTIQPDPQIIWPNERQGDVEDEAMSVRRHLLRNTWSGFTTLTKFRRWILILRLFIALAQVVAGITVLALPSSLGDSYSYPETCDPEGMFVYLTLHCARVLCSVPIDLYLGLSPHRSPRARRVGAEGLAERERNRRLGSLRLDRKAGRISDLLGLCHMVLFIVGNYVVWTSFECSHAPADSRPLFFTCIAMLCITYIIILEVALMVFLVVFFLPLLIACFSVLGITHRLPQRAIHPETGKISQDEIEKYTRLVFFTPAEGYEEMQEKLKEATGASKLEAGNNVDKDTITHAAPTNNIDSHSSETEQTNGAQERKRWRIGRLIGLSRRQPSSTNLKRQQKKGNQSNQSSSETGSESTQPNRYPLYPIPAHRATCPICLCDYEEVNSTTNTSSDQPNTTIKENQEIDAGQTNDEANAVKGTSSSSTNEALEQPTNTIEQTQEPEPLRLLRCGHAMHKQCVDQWLSTVSGRCPVCQKAILPSGEGEEGEGEGEGRENANSQQTNQDRQQ